MVLTIPCAIGFMTLGKPIISMLYPRLSTESTSMAAGLLLYGGIAIIFYGFSSILNGVLQGVGKVNFPVLSSSIALVFHVLLLYVLLKYTNIGTISFIIATLLYVLIIVAMNYWKVKQYIGYTVEWRDSILMPLFAAVMMGAVSFLSYNILYYVLATVMGEYVRNAISAIVAILVAAITYIVCLLKFGGYTEEMLLAFPKGALVVEIAKKMKLTKSG
ncbi:MAG: polysaccharide biosynthesis C-terminal domain-containing protein [Lachnospiraceae bacterium]|nr:polysaccharide biosynthesis C-terminal domain-containing protein [Lachnospiraceae bacterium]